MSEKVKEAYERNRQASIYAAASKILLAAAIVIAAGLIFFVRFFSRSILERLSLMANFMKKLSEGNLDQSVITGSRDEIGEMARAIATMNSYLTAMARTAEKIAGGGFDKRCSSHVGQRRARQCF